MSYTGKIIQIICGCNTGAEYMVISEPKNVNRRGDTGVKVKCIKTSNLKGGHSLGEECTMSFEEIYDYGIFK